MAFCTRSIISFDKIVYRLLILFLLHLLKALRSVFLNNSLLYKLLLVDIEK